MKKFLASWISLKIIDLEVLYILKFILKAFAKFYFNLLFMNYKLHDFVQCINIDSVLNDVHRMNLHFFIFTVYNFAHLYSRLKQFYKFNLY